MKKQILILSTLLLQFGRADNTAFWDNYWADGSFTEPRAVSKYNGTKTVTKTIVINKSGTYDFENVLHVWKGTSWNCNGEKENGPQILRIEASNVIVKNFAYIGDGKTNGSKGLGDPIHIATCGTGQGNLCSGKISNVTLDGIDGHACEDMITVGTPNGSNITIQNSILRPTPDKNHWDKTVQVNFGTNIRFINNRFIGGERCVRLKPNTSAYFEKNSFEGCNQPIRATSNDADIKPMKNGKVSFELRGNTFKNTNNGASCDNKQNRSDGKYSCG